MKKRRNLSLNSTRIKACVNMAEIWSKLKLEKEMMEMEMTKVRNKFQESIRRMELEYDMNKQLGKQGWIYVSIWSRDCDCCESTSVRKFQSIKKYYQYVDKIGDWAEGPVSVNFITKDEYDAFSKPGNTLGRVRDRVMEAYENGNGNSIWV